MRSRRFRIAALIVAIGCMLLVCCSGDETPSAAKPAAAEEPDSSAQIRHAKNVLHEGRLASRAQGVALADQLALGAAQAEPQMQQRVARVVGDVRLLAYRTFHTATDAREAVEQYKAAAKASSDATSCEAKVASMVLQAEVESDPAALYMGAYAELKQPAGPCDGTLRDLIDHLQGFRPDGAALAEIDQRIAATRTPMRAAPQGPVVQPEATKLKPSKIQGLETFGARDAARVVIELTGPAKYEVGALEGGEASEGARLYIDLIDTKRGAMRKPKEVGGLLQRVRVGTHKEKTRVVLDLERQVFRRVFFLPEPFRIVIDVSMQPPSEPQGLDNGRRSVGRVVIDPGHGGADPGAIGPGGLREKDVTLDIAHRLAPVLARELGVATMLTRDDDRYVALEERAARANAFRADLFVSVHCNAADKPESRGLQSYVLDMSRDDIASRVAARENATSAAANQQMGLVLAGLRSDSTHQASVRFAGLIQRATMGSLGPRYGDTLDGGVRSAAFFVLVGAEMPSVLFEAAFISNPDEEMRLATADYRQKLADGIANAIRAYIEGK